MSLLLGLCLGCQSVSLDSDKDHANTQAQETGAPTADQVKGPLADSILQSFSAERMRDDVRVLASEEFGGRIPGSYGHALARDYLLAEMEAAQLLPIAADGSYVQSYANTPVEDRFQLLEDGTVAPQQVEVGYNLVGMIPGSDPELADEYIVLMAHYDHLGVDTSGDAFNGAFDNATSVAMCLEIARVFAEQDIAPGRSIVMIMTDDEEFGLDGAEAWLRESDFPIGEVILGLSLDPTGRPVLPDFWPIVIIGLERSPSLLARFREMAMFAEVPVFFINREVIPVFASDQDRFYAYDNPIAAGWYTNPGMSFYHTTDDTPITIDYRVLLANVRFIAQAITELGNDDQRYPYEGETHLGAQAANDAIDLLQGVLESSVLDQSEIDQANFLIGELEKVVEQDDVDALDSPDAFFFAAVYFVLFELSYAHPGEVPPPFPEQ